MKQSGINYQPIIQGLLNFSLLVLYCSAIFWLSGQSTLPTPKVFNQQDKLLHVGAFFVMGVLAWRAFSSFINNPTFLATVALVFCSLYGWSDEWHQSFVPGRYSSILDWVADTIGAALSIGLLLHYRKGKQSITHDKQKLTSNSRS